MNKLEFIQNYIISAISSSAAHGSQPPKPHELVEEAEDYWNEIYSRYALAVGEAENPPMVGGILHQASVDEAQAASMKVRPAAAQKK